MTDLDVDLKSTVFIESSQFLNGALRFQSESDKLPREYLDENDTLKNWINIAKFEKEVQNRGLKLHFVGDAKQRFDYFKFLVTQDVETNSLFLNGDNNLYWYQKVAVNLCMTTQRVLLRLDTGLGKTVIASIMQEMLFDIDEIDIAIVFCKSKPKVVDWANYLKENTNLAVTQVKSSWTRERRHAEYEKCDADVYVMNYEKGRYPQSEKPKNGSRRIYDWSKTDLLQLLELVNNQRVLFIFDEAQKMGNKNSLVSKGIRRLSSESNLAGIHVAMAYMIGLTATPYNVAPGNIHNIFSTLVPELPFVSRTRKEFNEEYVKSWWRDPQNNPVSIREWDQDRLPLLGKRIERHTLVVSKDDPEIAKLFPEMVDRVVTVELSDHDRKVYDAARDIIKDWISNSPLDKRSGFNLLRMICATSESMQTSDSYVAQKIRDRNFKLDTSTSEKYAAVESHCETILDANEKIILFTHWANHILKPYMSLLMKLNAPVFAMHGEQTESEQQKNINEFQSIEGGAILLMSDAGQEGLNLYVPYLAHIEIPTTYSAVKQRRDRIHRIDSKQKGIFHTWNHMFTTLDTIETVNSKRVLRRKHEDGLIFDADEDDIFDLMLES